MVEEKVRKMKVMIGDQDQVLKMTTIRTVCDLIEGDRLLTVNKISVELGISHDRAHASIPDDHSFIMVSGVLTMDKLEEIH